jgi:KaiC/GvpD/RAD55 family RecA-like ATPase
MLDGGLIARRPYLLVGPSGTGKTTLGLQFLCAGVRQGEHTLLVTLEEPPNEVRVNHHRLAAELEKVDVFDAIPDVMRYERAPFKDISAVRAATPFGRVPVDIRRTPELTSVEVTITALEQMLRTEVQRHAYTRIVIDSLTALQYFCMKGFDIVAGAQTFLRFLTDLKVTTILTVEAPLEDIETPERMLARGEIRLFRWELNDITVRAIGVEKFRGSSHDIRLHPYRIGSSGLDINLAVTISRDTREIVESPEPLLTSFPAAGSLEAIPSTLEVVAEELRDLRIVGADTSAVRAEVEAALTFARRGDSEDAGARLTRAVALGLSLADRMPSAETPAGVEVARALHRLSSRADAIRAGQPPVRIPEPPILAARLTKILSDLQPASGPPPQVAEAIPSAGPVPAAPTGVPSPVTPPPTAPEPIAAPISKPSPTPLEPGPIAPAPAKPLPEVPEPTPPTTVAAPTPKPSVTPPSPAPRPDARVRTSPPPLPRPARYPEPPLIPRDSAGTPLGRPDAAAPVRPPTRGAPRPAARIEGAEASEAVEAKAPPAAPAAAEGPRPKKRKRAAPGSRKKVAVEPPPPATPPTGEAVAPAPSPPADSTPRPAPELPPISADLPDAPPVASTDLLPSAAPTEPPAVPRPKRRVVRKKKAPQVIGATPGPVPEETPQPPATPSPDPLTADRPPEAT